jgi:hypothetical protein
MAGRQARLVQVSSGRVDGYRDASQWHDDTASYRQISEVVSRVLDYTASPADKESFRYALSYYLTANVDVDVELSASVPVSGLQLLAFLRFVTHGPVWLLVSQAGIQTSIPAHFGHLAKAQAQLASTGAPARDALGTVVKMRNVVTRPTRDQPGTLCSRAAPRPTGRRPRPMRGLGSGAPAGCPRPECPA